ncbi:MAG: hypothetical protein Q8P98_14220, partial [Candidatus Rokubacteria bacterium]|nr:hypothetical protein [Candidatus Rokubacteria bacterium]
MGGLVNVNAAGSIFNPPGTASGTSINLAGVDADNTLHFPPTVTGQIFWNDVLLWPLAPPVPGGGGHVAAAAFAAATQAVLQQGTPACGNPLGASDVTVSVRSSLSLPA